MNRPLSRTARDKILESACALIDEVGADRFSVDEVVRRSGVAKTTIYRHFSSAARLLVTALDSIVVQPPEIDTGSLLGDLEAVVEHYLPILNSDRKLMVLLTVLRASMDDPEIFEIRREMLEARFRPMVQMIERAQARNEIDPGLDPQIALSMLEGPMMIRRLMTGERLSEADARITLERSIRALAPAS